MLSIWSLRRALLAGDDGPMLRSMHRQLSALGARPAHLPDIRHAQTLDHALHKGRFSCVIAPDLSHLCPGTVQRRLDALDMLLFEMREAGVPLAILLAHAQDSETALLISHALRFSDGACGDPVSVQCFLHTDEDTDVLCRKALQLGARFLAGQTDRIGVFTMQEGKRHNQGTYSE